MSGCSGHTGRDSRRESNLDSEICHCFQRCSDGNAKVNLAGLSPPPNHCVIVVGLTHARNKYKSAGCDILEVVFPM